MTVWYSTARGACSPIPATAAARAARAQARSVSANVRCSRGAVADATATCAPARRSAPFELRDVGAQPGRRAEGHDEDVGRYLLPPTVPSSRIT